MFNNTLTDVPGIRVGHVTDLDAVTGCTVILCPDGTVGGVDQRGGAPGTRETDLLRPLHLVETINAVILAGGSAYGLAAADGAMRWLEAHDIGYRSGTGFLVPIVPAAILMDLAIGRSDVRPDAAMGYAACEAASAAPVAQGCVGAGTGCRVGAMLGNQFATKGGIGSASVDLGDGLIVAALCAVNAVGDVVDEQGQIIAGVRQPPDGSSFAGVLNLMKTFAREERPRPAAEVDRSTVLGVVATNAKLTKEQANKVAQMAQNGLGQAIRPAHTMWDGDTLFALATGQITANVTVIGAYAAEVVAQAIRNAVRAATTLAGVRALSD
ncbi:MAG: P1 family peptidase [Chloroflexi bacterium]|nr:P1 family peptidase [Chloroflexota bacterium]